MARYSKEPYYSREDIQDVILNSSENRNSQYINSLASAALYNDKEKILIQEAKINKKKLEIKKLKEKEKAKEKEAKESKESKEDGKQNELKESYKKITYGSIGFFAVLGLIATTFAGYFLAGAFTFGIVGAVAGYAADKIFDKAYEDKKNEKDDDKEEEKEKEEKIKTKAEKEIKEEQQKKAEQMSKIKEDLILKEKPKFDLHSMYAAEKTNNL